MMPSRPQRSFDHNNETGESRGPSAAPAHTSNSSPYPPPPPPPRGSTGYYGGGGTYPPHPRHLHSYRNGGKAIPPYPDRYSPSEEVPASTPASRTMPSRSEGGTRIVYTESYDPEETPHTSSSRYARQGERQNYPPPLLNGVPLNPRAMSPYNPPHSAASRHPPSPPSHSPRRGSATAYTAVEKDRENQLAARERSSSLEYEREHWREEMRVNGKTPRSYMYDAARPDLYYNAHHPRLMREDYRRYHHEEASPFHGPPPPHMPSHADYEERLYPNYNPETVTHSRSSYPPHHYPRSYREEMILMEQLQHNHSARPPPQHPSQRHIRQFQEYRSQSMEEDNEPRDHDSRGPPPETKTNSEPTTNLQNHHPNSKPETTQIGCTCKKSKCLKLYCQCFAASSLCGPNCSCLVCKNTLSHESERNQAIQSIRLRNPNAFDTKFKSSIPPSDQRIQVVAHKLGCKCRKSACLKKYCECYNANVKCSSNCRCVGCQNMSPGGSDGRNGHVTTVVLDDHPVRKRMGRNESWMMDAAQNLAFLKNGSMASPSETRSPSHPSTPLESRKHAIPAVTSAASTSTSTTSQSPNRDIHSIPSLTVSEGVVSKEDDLADADADADAPPSQDNDNKDKKAPPTHAKGGAAVNTLLMAAYAMTELSASPPNSPTLQPKRSFQTLERKRKLDSELTNTPQTKTANATLVTPSQQLPLPSQKRRIVSQNDVAYPKPPYPPKRRLQNSVSYEEEPEEQGHDPLQVPDTSGKPSQLKARCIAFRHPDSDGLGKEMDVEGMGKKKLFAV